MKHLLFTLNMLIAASAFSGAEIITGDSSAVVYSDSIAVSEKLSKGFSSKLFNPSKSTTPLFSKQDFQNSYETDPYNICGSHRGINNFKTFLGVGNTNLVSDIVTLTDQSFVGELGWQVRGGVRIYDNYELNIGIYGRTLPGAAIYPQLSYNKFLGYSAALVYEFKISGAPRWGIPFGFEVLNYNKNFEYTLPDGIPYSEHYSALAYGPKIGLRYHLSKMFFMEMECDMQYEQYKNEINGKEKTLEVANKMSSFKFFGVSVNRCF